MSASEGHQQPVGSAAVLSWVEESKPIEGNKSLLQKGSLAPVPSPSDGVAKPEGGAIGLASNSTALQEKQDGENRQRLETGVEVSLAEQLQEAKAVAFGSSLGPGAVQLTTEGLSSDPDEEDQAGTPSSRGHKRSALEGGLGDGLAEGAKDDVEDSLDESKREFEGGEGTSSGRNSKKPRLVWTAELHSRFMNAVNHLGVKNAVPKTILQLMNVEGMTRENVASHLQKYRLYLKRLAGLPPSARLPADMLPGGGQPYYGLQPQMEIMPGMMMPAQPMAMAAPPTHQAYPAAPHGMGRPELGAMLQPSGGSTTAVGMPLSGRMDAGGGYPAMDPLSMGGNYGMSIMPRNMQYGQQLYGYPQPPATIRQPWEPLPGPGPGPSLDPGLVGRPGGQVPAMHIHTRSAPGVLGPGNMGGSYSMPAAMPSMAAVGAPVAGTVADMHHMMPSAGMPLNMGQSGVFPGSPAWQPDAAAGAGDGSMAGWVDERGRHRWPDGGMGGAGREW